MSGEAGGDVSLVAKAVKRNRLGRFTEHGAKKKREHRKTKQASGLASHHSLPSHLYVGKKGAIPEASGVQLYPVGRRIEYYRTYIFPQNFSKRAPSRNTWDCGLRRPFLPTSLFVNPTTFSIELPSSLDRCAVITPSSQSIGCLYSHRIADSNSGKYGS